VKREYRRKKQLEAQKQTKWLAARSLQVRAQTLASPLRIPFFADVLLQRVETNGELRHSVEKLLLSSCPA
jgi:hypothetical protein